MATNRRTPKRGYGLSNALQKLYPLPIIAQRAPTANDRAEIGVTWIDQAGNDIYMLLEIVAGASNWTPIGAGHGVFDSVTATTYVSAGTYMDAGTTITAGTGLATTLGSVTCTAMAATGTITNTAAGLFESVALANGELLIGATGAAPIAATLTAGAGIAIAEAANAITITATGATAVQYTADDANTIVPDGAGNVNILGGVNVGTTAAIANTVTINVDAAPTFAGLVSCNLGILVDGADVNLESATNAGQDIYLHADGGIAETIEIYADQGTGINALASVYIHSDDGGITIDSGIASAAAVVINALNAVGGIDINCGAGGFDLLSGGAVSIGGQAASDFTVVGASLDLTLESTGGSVIVEGTEAVATAVQITASAGAGGVTLAAGTGGFICGATNGPITITSGTGAIDIGTDAAAHIVTLGNQDTTSQTIIESGTDGITLDSTDEIIANAAGLFTCTADAAAANAFSVDATDAAGGITLAAGTGGLLFGNQADCTTIDIGDFAPGASRTTTIAGGTVIVAAVTDLVDIAPDGATTNANSIKQVNINTGVVAIGESLTYIASGNVTSGTHTVSIQTGDVTAGTVLTGISTGTGTKTVNVGNADANTTVNIDAIVLINDDINAAVSINTGTSTGTVTIGGAAAGAIAIDTAAGISLDAATASNFTVTGAADLTIESTGGGVDLTSALAAADAITLDASDAAGGITVSAGTGGLIFGNQADCTTIDLGNFAPTANRTITVGGGTVITAATTDTIDIGPDGATTNANSIKTVNINTGGVTLGEIHTNVATGAITSGTHHVGIQSGNVTAGTVTTDLSTGTGTKIVNVGNADANTTVNIDAITNINTDINAAVAINTGTSTGTITLGDVANTGNIAVASAGTVLIDSVGVLELNSSGGAISIGDDDVDQNINIGTTGERVIAIGNGVGVTGVTIDSASADITLTSTDDITLAAAGGDLSLDAATVDINATGGATSMTPATGTVAGTSLTLDARVGVCQFTGQTTAGGADLDIDITNSFVSAGIGVLVTVSNQGANDADITVEGVNTHTAGHLILHCINSGAAALNGNVTVTFWVIN